MALTCGVVGLPNVGKSLLFNVITNASALVANYAFATIEPNVGFVEVPDERLDYLFEVLKPKKRVPAVIEITDIAGLVQGASKGEGLGNKFLSHIRNVDAIIHVVRFFEDENTIHVNGKVNPLHDVEIINLELMLSDLEIVEQRLPKIEKKAQMKINKDVVLEYETLTKIKQNLQNDIPIRRIKLNELELKAIKDYSFLTLKPVLYVANIHENIIGKETEDLRKLQTYVEKDRDIMQPICVQLEASLLDFDLDEREELLQSYNINASGLDTLIKTTYKLLGLRTFFSTSEKEVRAWTYRWPMTAKKCAGLIHTDFERGFIKAEAYTIDDLKKYGSEKSLKENGKLRLEGKDYSVVDGDVLFIRFNV